MGLQKRTIETPHASKPIGPYSQAVIAGKLLFCSGLVGASPQDGQLVGPTVIEQTQQALQNLSAVLQEAGCDTGAVVKTTVFLQNMSDFRSMNEVYGRFFSAPFPARSTVEVARLPLGALVEIEAIAMLS